ncbi:hypothetical protein CEE45_03500 [Candidatus Heimdallarchaeota archaeon B3_Heim]|nr:MAG: hypothetical protein CEE45_03500 [Candidatus Heimdallarchaeota archaeon B3_Heim]
MIRSLVQHLCDYRIFFFFRKLLFKFINLSLPVARIVVSTIFEQKIPYDLPLIGNGTLEWYGEEYDS